MVNNIVLSGMAWMSSIRNAIAERISEESGQDLIEYAVLVGAIGVAAFISLAVLGPGAFDTMTFKIKDCVTFSTACGT